MFEMKKDSFFNLENLSDYFNNNKRFNYAILNLWADGYIAIKNENNFKKINIEEKGAFAVGQDFFKEKNNNLKWSWIKDYGMLLANVAVAIVAVVALANANNGDYANKNDVLKIQSRLDSIILKSHQRQCINNNPKNQTIDSTAINR